MPGFTGTQEKGLFPALPAPAHGSPQRPLPVLVLIPRSPHAPRPQLGGGEGTCFLPPALTSAETASTRLNAGTGRATNTPRCGYRDSPNSRVRRTHACPLSRGTPRHARCPGAGAPLVRRPREGGSQPPFWNKGGVETRAVGPAGSGSAGAAGKKGSVAGLDTHTTSFQIILRGKKKKKERKGRGDSAKKHPASPTVRATSAADHVGRSTETAAHASGTRARRPLPSPPARGGTPGGHVSEARAAERWGGRRAALKGGGREG